MKNEKLKMKDLGNDIAVDQKRPERAAATSPRQRLGGCQKRK
jgi:hypothetical protein